MIRFLCICPCSCAFAALLETTPAQETSLPGTDPLTAEGDLSVEMAGGIYSYFDRRERGRQQRKGERGRQSDLEFSSSVLSSNQNQHLN